MTAIPSSPVSPVSPRPTAFCRRREWHMWRARYLDETPAEKRGAWVQEENKARSCLAIVRDLALGSIKLQARHLFESGTLLQVELWDEPNARVPTNLLVRVIRVVLRPGSGEYQYTCTFCPARGVRRPAARKIA